MFGWYQNCFYLCTRFSEVKYSGCSAVRLAHLLWEQGVVGSNPAGITTDGLVFRQLNSIRLSFPTRPATTRSGPSHSSGQPRHSREMQFFRAFILPGGIFSLHLQA